MSEMIGCTVRVKIPASWLVHRRAETYPGSGHFFNDPEFRPADPDNDDDPLWALANLADNIGGYLDVDDVEGEPGAVIVTMQGELNYGFGIVDPDRGGELVRLRIPFQAWNDAKYEYEGDLTTFDGNPDGTLGGAAATNDGDPYIAARDLRAMLAEAEDDMAQFGARVFAWLYEVKFDLGACDISHLIP